MRSGTRVAAVGMAIVVCALGAAAAPAAAPAPPPNDNRANAQQLGTPPASATGTTAGATTEPAEPYSSCGSTGPSVWYEITVGPTPPDRIAVTLQANGDLDAIVDVFVRQRSQNIPVSCDQTDKQGASALAFVPQRSTTYLIRVAQAYGSVSGTFTLSTDPLGPAARAPGARLPPGGAGGTLRRVVDEAAAWSAPLRGGRSYRVNLVNRSTGCMALDVYGPDATSFSGAALASLPCGGYRLFTPQDDGRYSFVVHASSTDREPQRYFLAIAPARASESAPGIFIRNYARVHGYLRGNRIDVLRLYRFDIVERSNLELNLTTSSPDSPFSLELRDDRGRMLECACSGTGNESMVRKMRPGRYYVAVRARQYSRGGFTLVRRSRAITYTHVVVDRRRSETVAPGQRVAIGVAVYPAASGPVEVEIERFDPLSRWQYAATVHLHASAGAAGTTFTPPYPGRWRFRASFTGTRTASPSDSGFSQILAADPLTQ